MRLSKNPSIWYMAPFEDGDPQEEKTTMLIQEEYSLAPGLMAWPSGNHLGLFLGWDPGDPLLDERHYYLILTVKTYVYSL